MCGLAGHFRPRGGDATVVLDAVTRAVEILEHRGPDDAFSATVDGLGAWGMCRLAIRDPREGRQPFWDGDVGVIFNGEIYNTDELRRNLEARGHRFRTRCDTEVVLAAYVEHQHAAFALFDGIFAVAVIDGPRNRVVLARDEFGVKPLFVRSVGGELSFASEPKALRPLGALRDGPDLDQLERFLRYHYVPEPDSPWHNVRRVPRGSYEVYDRDDLSLVGTGRFQQPASDLGDGDWLDRADRAVRLSVTRQLVADRPLGVFLSGGIDSTLVSSYAAELHPGLRAFGIGVAWANDERRWMREATTRLDVDLTETELTEPDFDRLLGSLLDTYDEPFADSSAIPTMLVSEVAAGDLRVVLSGDGGDELFGGYPRYGSAWLAESLGGLPPALIRAAGALSQRAGRDPARILDRLVDESRAGGGGYAGQSSVISQTAAAGLLGRTDPTPTTTAPLSARWPVLRSTGYERAMQHDRDQYLPADLLTKVDRATMRVSLEARVPLLGAPVARLADAMPVGVKVRGGVGKWPLKELLVRRGFSTAFVHRPKTGFGFPLDDWLRRAIARNPGHEELLRRPPEPIDRTTAGRALDDLLAGGRNGETVWATLVLAGWLERNGRPT